MRQVKWILVILALVNYLNVSYSSSNESNNSVISTLKEYGPFTICADRVTYDSYEGTLTYSGNVFVVQICNKCILCRKVEKPKQGLIYFTRNKKDTFKQLQEKWFNQAKKICSDEKKCNFISGQKLTIQLIKGRKIKTLVMDSEGDEVSQFYMYPVDASRCFKNIKHLTKGPLSGEGKQVTYNVINKSLELHEEAIVSQNGNQYKGNEIIYDMNHDLINIRGSKNQRSITILDGIQKETKIDVGLKPIIDSHKYSTTKSRSTLNIANYN